jgi:hypothetical protein
MCAGSRKTRGGEACPLCARPRAASTPREAAFGRDLATGRRTQSLAQYSGGRMVVAEIGRTADDDPGA